MRHEPIRQRDIANIVDIDALALQRLPSEAEAEAEAEFEADEAIVHGPTPAVPDLPPAVGRAIVGIYAALVLVFLLTMGKGGQAVFMIAISALYVTIFMAVPRIFFAVEKDGSKRPDMSRFMERGIDTNTGRMSGSAALLQMFAVPVLVTLGVLAMGLIALAVLP